MATYKTYLKKVNKKGEAPIYISFYLNREKIEIPTKISIPPSSFDKETGSIKKSHEFYQDKNLILSNIRARINDIHVRYRLRNERLNATLFWTAYNTPSNNSNFFDFCTEYQRLRFQELTLSSQKKHKACLNNLKGFRDKLFFDELTEDFFRKFILHLRNKRGNNEVTINKTIRIISIYMNAAVKKEIIKTNPIKNLKMRGFVESSAEALSNDELQILYTLYNQRYFTGTTHDVLEFFLFMCFSSLHISDARNITIEQIGDNEFWYMRQKMLNVRPKVVRVPISENLKKIINHVRKNRDSGQLFDNMIADQKVNEKLKVIAKSAGIEKQISAKYGRHTFATVFLRGTRDINTLKEIMGHSNIKQTLVYAHVLDQDRKEGIQVFDAFI